MAKRRRALPSLIAKRTEGKAADEFDSQNSRMRAGTMKDDALVACVESVRVLSWWQGGIRTAISQMAVFCGFECADICQHMTVEYDADNGWPTSLDW